MESSVQHVGSERNGLKETSEDETSKSNETHLYNAQELEDCDQIPEREPMLYLFNSDSNKTSHYASFSGRTWLFNIPSAKDCIDFPPKFCLRYGNG